MVYIGIDFGTKRVGLAVSDESGRFSFPKKVLVNDKKLVQNIKKFCEENNVGGIVLGESKNFKGEDNKIMKEVSTFKTRLQKETGLPVFWEPEFMTSQEASRIQGESKMLDASAAALILKSFLEKRNN